MFRNLFLNNFFIKKNIKKDFEKKYLDRDCVRIPGISLSGPALFLSIIVLNFIFLIKNTYLFWKVLSFKRA